MKGEFKRKGLSTSGSGETGDIGAPAERYEEVNELVKQLEENLFMIRGGNYNFKTYDGKNKGEEAEKWLQQFLPYISRWKDELILSYIAVSLEGRAGIWYEGARGEEINNYQEFEKEFRRIFCKKTEYQTGELFKLLNTTISLNNIFEHFSKIRNVWKKTNIGFEEVHQEILKNFSGWVGTELENVKNFKELLDKALEVEEKYVKNSKRRIGQKLTEEGRGKDKKNATITSKTLDRKNKSIACYVCAGPHYAFSCPRRRDKLSNSSGNNNERRESRVVDSPRRKDQNSNNTEVKELNSTEMKTILIEDGDVAEEGLYLDIELNEQRISAYLDNGADRGYIDRLFALNNNFKLEETGREMEVSFAKEKERIKEVKAKGNIIYEGKIKNLEFTVVDDLNENLIFGRTIFNALGIDISYRDQVVRIGEDYTIPFTDCVRSRIKVKKDITLKPQEVCVIEIESPNRMGYIEGETKEVQTAEATIVGPTTTSIPVVNVTNREVKLARGLDPLKSGIVIKEIDKLLKEDKIQESNSLWNSPIVMVRKADKSYRMCIDFRKINEITVKELTPPPLLEDCLDCLVKARIFSVIDLKDGYHQILLDQCSRKYTAFTTPIGKFEFKRMPFGLTNAPSTFQKYMNSILSRVARWLMFLSEYDFDIVYNPGSKNNAADTMSRICTISLSNNYLLNEDGEEKLGEEEKVKQIHKLLGHAGIESTYLQSTDYCTRWCEAIAVKNKEAKIVAKFLLDKIVLRYGPPKIIRSDRGTEFLNEVIKELKEVMKIKWSYTLPYNPQANGLVERTNQSIIRKLIMIRERNPGKLEPRWFGPFIVSEKYMNGGYKVRSLEKDVEYVLTRKDLKKIGEEDRYDSILLDQEEFKGEGMLPDKVVSKPHIILNPHS
ncbi:uncharacterized protein LOC114933284 [Nylanderia fulva]|uniref:uncharacterized protein LOC114933284 n=1 Tax=Nylanderia fulva TaxID=613905 RepID=UPI0010FB297F|nr:uncharacterized protein LOC114933284 [Nylanderia fulva]